MRSLAGTDWVRKSDGARVQVTADACSSGSNPDRYVLARNVATGRSYWITPRGLYRKYDKAVAS